MYYFLNIVFRLTPSVIKPFVRPLFNKIYLACSNVYKKISIRQLSAERQQEYWKSPWNGKHDPITYLETGKAGQFLMSSIDIVEVIKRYVDKDSSILEIGCGSGRNLNALFNAGFVNLEGIEIGSKMVEVLNQFYPMMAKNTHICNDSVERALHYFKNNSFDIVFSVAVLTYIHPKSSWVFNDIVRVTNKYLITVEPETKIHFLTFPRNYKEVFSRIGMVQIFENNSDNKMVTRIFQKLDDLPMEKNMR